MQKLQLPAISTRFAPTPSGYLHIGNVYSFLLTWLLARKNAGRIFLRIDDLDRERVRPEYVENIFRVLEWLGLDWDAGPASVDDFQRHYSQVHRMELYNQMLESLQNHHQVFACECSRKQLKEQGFEEGYPGICISRKPVPSDGEVVWRLDTTSPTKLFLNNYRGGRQEWILPASQQHFIVKRRDGLPAYHLASVADDLHFGINLIVRGQDLFDSTLAQLYLAKSLAAGPFMDTAFLHHPLIFDNTSKLSKSQNASSVLDEFYPDKAKLFRKLGSWMGLLPDQCGSLDLILKNFSPSNIITLSNPMI